MNDCGINPAILLLSAITLAHGSLTNNVNSVTYLRAYAPSLNLFVALSVLRL